MRISRGDTVSNTIYMYIYVGFLCIRHFEVMLGKDVRDLYHDLLMTKNSAVRMKCQVLRNIQNYLLEEEDKMMRADAECKFEIRAVLDFLPKGAG